MKNVLDNPAWNALISGNKTLSFGGEEVKYFAPEVSPFAGFKEYTPEHFRTLYDLMPGNRLVLLVSPAELKIPDFWKTLQVIRGLQMIYAGSEPLTTGEIPAALGNEQIADMLSLTRLTNPGPFESGTIKFGHYYGIFEKGKLVAMAGQRMHVFNYAEISAVCTHPEYTGRGYARQLMVHQIQRMLAGGADPILHVKFENKRAIQMYEQLGFRTRTEVYFHALVKIPSDNAKGSQAI